jgi:hypothetical protein
MEDLKVTKSELKVIEERLIALERAIEILLDRGNMIENQAKLEEWY